MSFGFKKTVHVRVPAYATDVEGAIGVGVAPFDGVIESVGYIPDAAITGANTNTRKVELINKGQAGSGTTVAADLQFNSGVNAAAFDKKAITNSATAANLDVAAGDVLAWSSTAPGTGLADPGGLLEIVFARS